MIDRAKILAQRYFSEKGYKNAEINIVQRDDAGAPEKIIVDVNIERKDKVKINRIYITGNEHLRTGKIKGNIIKPGVLKRPVPTIPQTVLPVLENLSPRCLT